jgi:hypothetical protein
VSVVSVDLASTFRVRSKVSRAVVAAAMWEGRSVALLFDELMHSLQPISQLVESTGSTVVSDEKGHVNNRCKDIAYTHTYFLLRHCP